MRSLIAVHPDFDAVWPFAADHFHELWKKQGPVDFLRVDHGENRMLSELIEDCATVRRVAVLGVTVTPACIEAFIDLEEATFQGSYGSNIDSEFDSALVKRGIKVYNHPSEGFWGASVSEFGLALTLCGLRRIPQLHHEILTGLKPWDYDPPEGKGKPGVRGHQFGDDSTFTSGTLEGKRVRIVGAGNIASRYASFATALGADVAAWDPFASEPCFHRSGTRRLFHLEELIHDAEIFAPMVPLNETTREIVNSSHINALPKGCLVVLVTRANICDMQAIRHRVLSDELSLAADVWDVEPLPLSDPLLGRHNVVHTPHNAGRTIDANKFWSEKLVMQFIPRDID